MLALDVLTGSTHVHMFEVDDEVGVDVFKCLTSEVQCSVVRAHVRLIK